MKKNLSFMLSIMFSIISFQTSSGQLPTQFPGTEAQLEADNLTIARAFAPVIRQMATTDEDNSVGGLADLITSVLYDDNGTPNTRNNWESLDAFEGLNPLDQEELDPYVYYSVVWTSNYWFITYAFYHPRDYASDGGACCAGVPPPINLPGDNHENDMEGVIVVATRSNGFTQGIATISHTDLLVYDMTPSLLPPIVKIDDGTHAVEEGTSLNCIQSAGNPCDDCDHFTNPHIVYTLAGGTPLINAFPSPQNSKYLVGEGEYGLLDIFGSDPNSLYNLKSDPDVFNGGDLFMSDGDTDCQQYGGSASAPWGWSQFNYDWWALNDLVFQLGLPSGSAFVRVLHNPYFNECNQGKEYKVGSFPGGEEISFLQSYSKFELLPYQTLTITDKELKMDANGEVILREGSMLILNNSKITNCSGNAIPSDLWNGVYAVDDQGVIARITMENGSTIENSEYGITNTDQFSTVNWHHPFGLVDGAKLDVYIEDSFFENNESCITMADGPNSTSGFLYVDNTVFTNNLHGIGFFGKDEGSLTVKFSEFHDTDNVISVTNSKVPVEISDNEIYEAQLTAIEFDQSRKINFKRNLIQDGDSRAIVVKDSQAKIVDDNKFDNNSGAIYSSGTFPNATSVRIGDKYSDANLIENSTSSATAAIRIDGNTHPAGAEVINNRVVNSTFAGIALNGANESIVMNNSVINAPTGFKSIDAGNDKFNYFDCNRFINNIDQDMQIQGENGRSRFLENSFDGFVLSPDINITDAEVHPFQGTIAAPADNCFQDNAPTDLNVTGTSLAFDYTYYGSIAMDNCEIPQTTGIYNPVISTIPGVSNCPQGVGSNFTAGTFDPNGFTTLDFEIMEYCDCFDGNIDDYIDKVVNGGGDDPRTEFDESSTQTEQLLEDEEQLDFWIRAAIYYAINNEDYAYGINVLKPLLKWEWQASLYGLYILSGQYAQAETHLIDLSENNLDQTYFKDVQRINIKRWTSNTLPYQPTQTELDDLYNIGRLNVPSSGYATSLYYAFTGDIVPIDITIPPRNGKRSIANEEEKNWVYPNPSDGLIEIDEKLAQDIKALEIFDRTGKSVHRVDKIGTEFSGILDLSFLSQGIYFIEVKLKNNSTKNSKLVII